MQLVDRMLISLGKVGLRFFGSTNSYPTLISKPSILRGSVQVSSSNFIRILKDVPSQESNTLIITICGAREMSPAYFRPPQPPFLLLVSISHFLKSINRIISQILLLH